MGNRVRTRLVAAATGVVLGLVTIVLAAAPAQADVLHDVGGYVWGYQPTTPSYTISGPDYFYGANDSGGAIHVTRLGVGRYRVRWAGLGFGQPPAGGIGHASAYGATANLCTVAAFIRESPDALVYVHCFNSAGALADTQFTANFVLTTGVDWDVPYSYVWAAASPTRPTYVPDLGGFSFDSTGLEQRVTRDGTGSYLVYLPSAAAFADQETTFYQVSAWSMTAVNCRTINYQGYGVIRVQCRNVTGTLVDATFTVTFSPHNMLLRSVPSALAVVQATPSSPPLISWTDGSDTGHPYTVTRLGTGSYRVVFSGMGHTGGHAVARAIGQNTLAHCHTQSWTRNSTDEIVNVRCYTTGAGIATDSSFTVGYTW